MSDGKFFIVSEFNHRVLEVSEGSIDDEAPIIVYTRKEVDVHNQLWRYEDEYFINVKSGKVLDICGGEIESGSSIIQYEKKDEDSANQKWRIEDGYIYCSERPDLVLDIQEALDEDCAPVILYEKREGDVASNQRWFLERYED